MRVPKRSLMVFWTFSVHSQVHCSLSSIHNRLRATSAAVVSNTAAGTCIHIHRHTHTHAHTHTRPHRSLGFEPPRTAINPIAVGGERKREAIRSKKRKWLQWW